MALPAYVNDLDTVVAQAIAEDLGSGDHTARLVPADQQANARVISRENAVICGRAWVDAVFAQIDAEVQLEWLVNDGQLVTADQVLYRLQGSARSLLTGERTALNFLQSLSGTATAVREYVDAVAGTGAAIVDTRKTLPGLRNAQKYAVLCVSWGALVEVTYPFLANYLEEAWCVIGQELADAKKDGLGIDLATLQADLKKLDR